MTTTLQVELIRKRVTGLAERLPGTAGVFISLPRWRQQITFNERVQFPSASLIKLPILSEYVQQMIAGQIDPRRVIEIQSEKLVGGSGIIKDLGPGAQFRLMDLASLMIIVSDNVATNLLIDILGLEQIGRLITDMGLEQTRLQRRMMDFEGRARGLENFTSPADMAAWFERLIDEQRDLSPDNLDDDASFDQLNPNEFMLEILCRQQERHKLPARLPEEVQLAHKTGEMSGIEHDAGIMWLSDEPVIVVAMSSNLARNSDGINFCQEIGYTVFEQLG